MKTLSKQVSLYTAANHHLVFELGDLPDNCWQDLAHRLVFEYGFVRIGAIIIGADEQIYPSFQCPEFTLAAGWDSWSGYYLLSESPIGDVFLKELFNRFDKQ